MRTPVPGGWYCDALPSGAFAVLIPKQHILTHLGVVPLPPGDPSSLGVLFIRITEVGGFRIAGQPHDRNDIIWEWFHESRLWKAHQTNYVCVSPVIYSRTGELLINTGSWGSQGARYMDAQNRVVTGDATYYDPSTGLSEWTDMDDGIRVGQGHDANTDPAVVWNPATKGLRQLEAGPCTFIRAHRDGARVSLAYVVRGGAVVVQTTIADLLAIGPEKVPGPIHTDEDKEPTMTPTLFDIHDVTVLGSSPRILDFPVTAQLRELGVFVGGIRLLVDGADSWPAVPIEAGGPPSQAGTLWVFLKIGGQWYATGAERLRPQQLRGEKPENDCPAHVIGVEWLYDPNRWGPMAGYNPVPGEVVGFMVVAGSTRSDDNTPVEARTQVAFFAWPPPDSTRKSLPILGRTDRIDPPDTPVDNPPVDNPPVDSGELANLRAENARLKAEVAAAAATFEEIARRVEELIAQARTPDYAQTLDMIRQADAAFQVGKKKRTLDPASCAHLTWGYLREGRTLAALIADAAARG